MDCRIVSPSEYQGPSGKNLFEMQVSFSFRHSVKHGSLSFLSPLHCQESSCFKSGMSKSFPWPGSGPTQGLNYTRTLGTVAAGSGKEPQPPPLPELLRKAQHGPGGLVS